MTDAAEKRMTVPEFLAWDDGTDTRYELVHGQIVAMVPTSASHAVIVSNLTGVLRSALKRPCYAGSNAGVLRPDRDDTFYEADVVISCTLVQAGMVPVRRSRSSLSRYSRPRPWRTIEA